MKANPWQLIRAHHETFSNYPSGNVNRWDYVLFWGVPAIIAVVCVVLRASLPEGASIGLLTTAGVLTAFFFGVMLQVSSRAMELADQRPEAGVETTWQAEFLQQIAANAGYASLLSVVVATLFVACLLATATWLSVILTAVGLGLAAQLGLLVSMVLTRIYALTTDRLDQAQVEGTSGTVTALHDRKTGSM